MNEFGFRGCSALYFTLVAGLSPAQVGLGLTIACGVVAGPLHLVVGYAQAFTREGFDLAKHPFSMLSLGSLGWIQIANFVVSGTLFVIAATGMAKHTERGARLIFLGGPMGTVLLYVVATIGWIWTTAVSLRLATVQV